MPWRLLAAIRLSSFLASLDYTAVNVALPTLSREFAVGTSGISWIALAYLLVVVALTLPAGLAMDRRPCRRCGAPRSTRMITRPCKRSMSPIRSSTCRSTIRFAR